MCELRTSLEKIVCKSHTNKLTKCFIPLKVQIDILQSLDNTCVNGIMILDLSADFDIIDHTTLLSMLDNYYKISGSVLAWISSYRFQTVYVEGELSEPVLKI